MVVEDVTAFVEKLEVATSTKRAEKLKQRATKAELRLLAMLRDVRILEEEVRVEERTLAAARAEASSLTRPSDQADRTDGLQRRAKAALARLLKKRDDAAKVRTQYEALERESGERTQHVSRTYRLHFEGQHVECSESQFAHLHDLQKATPVWVTTLDGRRLWWFLERFWWDAWGMKADEVRGAVLERDWQGQMQRNALARAEAEILGWASPRLGRQEIQDDVRARVWQRDLGRCVDCGSPGRVVFDLIVSLRDGGSLTAANIELRCEACVSQRRQNQARASVTRAAIDARAADEWGVELTDLALRGPASDTDES